jgi:hypothetical protein
MTSLTRRIVKEQLLQTFVKVLSMKKMEKTAGEKTGKDEAIRKDSEASAEKIVIPDPVTDGDKKKEKNAQSEKEAEDKLNQKKTESATPQKDSTSNQTPPEKGKGLKSAVEGNNKNSPLPTDDDGTIVL